MTWDISVLKNIETHSKTKVMGNDWYEVSNVPGFSKTKKYCSVIAADRMRPWINIKALNVVSDSESESSSASGHESPVY